jgi:hypothetical protein
MGFMIGESIGWVRCNGVERGRSKLRIEFYNVLVPGVVSVEIDVAQ